MVGYIASAVVMIVFVLTITRYHPVPTGRIAAGVWAVSGEFMNFYAVKSKDGVILFDTGMRAATARRGLRKLGIDPEAVRHIFLTHTDFDHAGGLEAFKNSKLYIAKPEEQLIDGTTARKLFLRNKPLSDYCTLEDGEIVEIGGVSVKTYLVPGHTPGSTAYLINERFLVSGDLLRVTQKGKVTPFLWHINMDHQQNIESIKRMRPVIRKAEYVLTGHSGVIKMKKRS
jgi:glyoxylase-like metal-dependent hydrolase (beta-lactamase superfamily II)